MKVIFQFLDPFSPLKLHVRYLTHRYYLELYRSLRFYSIFVISASFTEYMREKYVNIKLYIYIHVLYNVYMYIFTYICIYTLEDCRRQLQLLHQPVINPRPHWPEAKLLTTTLACTVCRLLHRAPPKHQGCERGALSRLLVSEMLKRSVEEEQDCTQWRSGCSDSDTACDL